MSPSLRLFVALYPPPESIAHWFDRLAALDHPTLDSLAPTPPAQVHLTLQFIGPASERELPDIQESIERSASGIGAFDLTPTAIATFPPQARNASQVRLIAVICNAPPPLLELHRRLAKRLARNTRERPGDRFTPHLTLARCKPPHPPQPQRPPHPQPEPFSVPLELRPIHVSELRLMNSILRPEGAEHRTLQVFGLDSK